MTILRFYLDEDATSKRLIQALRNRGADVLSAADSDRPPNAPELLVF